MVEKPLRTDMKRILIVEDNAFFLQFLKETMRLRFPSIDILEAASGEEAMRKIKTLSPEAIFMDLRLPGENGLEVTKKIKAQYPDIVVVILTNYDLPEYREAAHQSGADHFVSKDSFLSMINSILTNQDIPKDNSDCRQPIERLVMEPSLNPRRSKMTVQDNGENE
jgi:DNA-binding NarL/FixJ family response regulator